MGFELRSVDPIPGKIIPSPMMLPIHDFQKRLFKRFARFFHPVSFLKTLPVYQNQNASQQPSSPSGSGDPPFF
jgi:hypothetical protein